MKYDVLASDYDGTLAEAGVVSSETLAAVERLRESGRKFVLVTGRRLDDLKQVFPGHAVCDSIVAENGAVLFEPRTGSERVLSSAPPLSLLARLSSMGVPFFTGSAIVATFAAHAEPIRTALVELELSWQMIFNKSDLMLLPTGIDKASGLRAALHELGFEPEQAIGVGDAENDLPLFEVCGLGVAPANALSAVKARAGWVTEGKAGRAVVELIERMLQAE